MCISLSSLDPVILIETAFHSMAILYVQGNIILLTQFILCHINGYYDDDLRYRHYWFR